MKKKEEAFFN